MLIHQQLAQHCTRMDYAATDLRQSQDRQGTQSQEKTCILARLSQNQALDLYDDRHRTTDRETGEQKSKHQCRAGLILQTLSLTLSTSCRPHYWL